MSFILKNSLHGYKKTDVLNLIDALNAAILFLDLGKGSKSEALEETKKALAIPLRTCLFGFNKEDTDRLIEDFVYRIENYQKHDGSSKQ